MTRPNTKHHRHPSARLGSGSCEVGGFSCSHCGFPVPNHARGTRHRNHCPLCLWSRHVDLRPGDRRSFCRGAMRPIAIWFKEDGEGALIHRCQRCGTLRSNRVAGDDDAAALKTLVGQIAACTATITQGVA